MSAAAPIEVDLARIAHDLRGPLMPLRTAAWLLRNEHGESDRIGELADIVDRQSGRLARMMDELSEWAHSSQVGMALKCEPVDVPLAVDMAICGIHGCRGDPQFTNEAATFDLHADQHRFGQLLRTLIEHAVQRDPDRLADIGVDVVSGYLNIRIDDHGAPLEAAARDALLSRPQAKPFDDGLGLRLLLARRIAEAHGGSLSIGDATGGGLSLVCAFPAGSWSAPAFPPG